MISYKERLNHITTFLFDVDGVLTNGEILLFKDEIVRKLNSRDAYAIQYAVKMGFKIMIVTGGNSEEVKACLLSLGVNEVHLSSSNKLAVYTNIKEQHGVRDEEILYMGDDIPDLEILKVCGLPTCPSDAVFEVKQVCEYISIYPGGKGCVRDIIEQVLKIQGKWSLAAEAFSG